MVVSAVALLSGAPGFGVSGQAWAAGAPCNTGTQTTSGTTITCTYASTGVEQTFSVPPGVTSVMVDVIGASGGVGGASGGGGIGGRGDDVSAALALSPGVSTLYVDVGGRGVNGGGGGFNGGGLGGGSFGSSGGGGGSFGGGGGSFGSFGGGGPGGSSTLGSGGGGGGGFGGGGSGNSFDGGGGGGGGPRANGWVREPRGRWGSARGDHQLHHSHVVRVQLHAGHGHA